LLTFQGSVLPLPELTKPLRPFFIHPATTFAPQIDPSPPFTPVVCVSASRWVNGDDGRGDPVPTATRLGDGWFAKTVAFDYVPGAGDDDELWGRVSLATEVCFGALQLTVQSGTETLSVP
jgi:tRNA A64-2'-O-ribosylphosphate transferase